MAAIVPGMQRCTRRVIQLKRSTVAAVAHMRVGMIVDGSASDDGF
jgi:hypothetical protein